MKNVSAIKFGKVTYLDYNHALVQIKEGVLMDGVSSFINRSFDYERDFTKAGTLNDEIGKMCDGINKALSPWGMGINAFERHKVIPVLVSRNYEFIRK